MMRTMPCGPCKAAPEGSPEYAKCRNCDRKEPNYSDHSPQAEMLEPVAEWIDSADGLSKRLICSNFIPLLTKQIADLEETIAFKKQWLAERLAASSEGTEK